VCQEQVFLVLLNMNDDGCVNRFDCTAACDGVIISDHDMMTLWFFFNLGSCMSNYEGIEISFC